MRMTTRQPSLPVLAEDAFFNGLLQGAKDTRQEIKSADVDRATKKAMLNNASSQTVRKYMQDDTLARSPDKVAFFQKSFDLFRRLYARGGPFSGAGINLNEVVEHDEVPKFAVLVHLVIREPETFGRLRDEVFGVLLHTQLTSPGNFQEMEKQISRFGHWETTLSMSDILADLEVNVHRYIHSHTTMAALQDRCGLSGLVGQGTDIKATLGRCLQLVEGTVADNKSFFSMFRLTLDCIKHLEHEGGIGAEEAADCRKRLLRDAIEVTQRQHAKDVNLWRPMLKEVVQVLDTTMSPGHVLGYMLNQPNENRDTRLLKIAAEMNPREFKKCLKQDYTEKDRYALISRANLQHLFTPNELLIMCGHQFSSDLGL